MQHFLCCGESQLDVCWHHESAGQLSWGVKHRVRNQACRCGHKWHRRRCFVVQISISQDASDHFAIYTPLQSVYKWQLFPHLLERLSSEGGVEMKLGIYNLDCSVLPIPEPYYLELVVTAADYFIKSPPRARRPVLLPFTLFLSVCLQSCARCTRRLLPRSVLLSVFHVIEVAGPGPFHP